MASSNDEAENPELEENGDLAEQISRGDVALAPSDTGDPISMVESKIPEDIRRRYEVYSYRNAAVILSEARTSEFADLLKARRRSLDHAQQFTY